MKKFITLLAMMTLALVQTAISQNITLSFSGTSTNGIYIRLDTIRVENTTRNWTETIVHPDNRLSFNITGINGAESSELELQSYPNPFNGKTTVRMSVPQSGNVILQIYNLAGQKIVETETFLNAGEHKFGITLNNANVNLLTIKTAAGQKTIKLLNYGGSESNAIVYNGMEMTEKLISTQIYQIGDLLRIYGYSSVYGRVVRSRELTKSPTRDEDIELVFETSNYHVPYINTASVSNVTHNSAVCGGNVTDSGGLAVTARGVCWSTSRTPDVSNYLTDRTIDGTGFGSFTSNITGLLPDTTYYVRAYATNVIGTGYGPEYSFTTTSAPPTVTTTAASNITDSSVVCGGNVTNAGSSAVTARGVCWSTSQNPSLSGNHTTNGSGTGSFTSSITGLEGGTTYYVCAYAISAIDTAYGSQITFTTTTGLPTVTTTAASSVTSTTATCGGNVTRTGGSAVTARGVCWSSTSLSPTTSGNHTTDSSGTGSFTSRIMGLTPGTRYFFRAYVTNASGTAYGRLMDFTTSAAPPTVTTTAASNVTDSTVVCGGNVTSAGSSAVTARGVCWSTSQNPTARGNHTTNGSGTGSFTSIITGLTAGTTYYVRAYAISAVDTAYGSQITFTTSALPPTVTTTAASNITSTTATSGGNVTSTGGSAITARGVCWSTSQNPTISGYHTTDSSGAGSFISSITGLTPQTTYYVRAYATNAAGTAYGNQISFTTTLPNNVFSTAAGLYVYFSPGNLQWSAKNGGSTATTHTVAGGGTAAGTWRFAPHQWDTIGAANSNISSSYSGWIDLFGWGTSGYNNKHPYMTSTTNTDYGNGANNIDATNYDWGVYNAIYNPKTSTTDAPGTWRTISRAEWQYLTMTRSTTSGIRYAKATVNGVPGLILVPDNWSTSTYAFRSTNTSNTAFASNVISAATWTTLENAGCVFLPVAGCRSGTAIYYLGTDGMYWTSTYYNNSESYNLSFNNSSVTISNIHRYFGTTVRLVKDYNNGQAVQLPTVTTTAASNITSSTATSGGNVTNAGGAAVTARGVCWSTSQNPTINSNHTTNGSGTGSFTSSITGLAAGTTYYVRAYATNTAGTAYGSQITFTTTAGLPTLTTTAASNITSTTATSGGNVTSTGGAAVTARGVCWSTSQNPTISDNHTTDGSGTGSFTSSLTGLTARTIYYVRAYATNAVGTAYGSEITFWSHGLATVTTTAVSNITATTATSGGNVTSTGYTAVTARGVCWGTSQNPTVSGNHTTDGSGTGRFTSNITGLTTGVRYYVRAYATNAEGTAYGPMFTFLPVLSKAFSVAAGRCVYFSPGNLQWSNTNGTYVPTYHTVAGGGTAAGTWRFAPNQWDTIGRANSRWTDLFGWGTSGYHNSNDQYNVNFYPYCTGVNIINTTYNYYGYGPSTNMSNPNLSGSNYDWGVYNEIYNPKTQTTDAPGTWRTLTKDEWEYLINTRNTTSGIRYAKAEVNGVPGLIIVPDDWRTSTYTLNYTNNMSAGYGTNVFTSAQWATLENAGAVFLPAAGRRDGSVQYVGSSGYYWSATYGGSMSSYYMFIGRMAVDPTNYTYRFIGQCVRLVKNAN